jgi:simple sugar transport system ATP-binding protein
MTKSFGSKVAVDDVTVNFFPGKILALLGENGAGKSTLISMICGQYRPDFGSLTVHGKTCNFRSPKDALKAGIGVVHQDFRLVPPFSVVENVVLGTRSRPNRRAAARIEELAAELGFQVPTHALVQDLVVGQQQQVEIIKLLFRGLDILILDEPTAVLTPQQSNQLFTALRAIADSGKSVVFVSHRLAEVVESADHVTVLRGGRVVADKPAHGLNKSDLALLMVGDGAATVTRAAQNRAIGHSVLRLTNASTAGQGRDVLNGASLELHAGEVVGVAGVSGNGQRPLADVVAGIVPLTSGTRETQEERIAYIPEDRLGTGLVGSMTIAQNLQMRDYRSKKSGNPWWINPRTLLAQAEPLIEEFHIPAAASIKVSALSGGGQQRVIVAREVRDEPRILVASQPTRGLDVVSSTAVREHLLDIADKQGAVLVISEDLDELLEVCDRILVMVGGEVVAEVPRKEATRLSLGLLMVGSPDGEVSQ